MPAPQRHTVQLRVWVRRFNASEWRVVGTFAFIIVASVLVHFAMATTCGPPGAAASVSAKHILSALADTPDPAAAARVVREYETLCGPGLPPVVTRLHWSYAFIVLLGAALALFSLVTMETVRVALFRALGVVASLFAIVAGIFGVAEHFAMSRLLRESSNPHWAPMADGFSSAKFGLLVAVFIYLVVAWSVHLFASPPKDYPDARTSDDTEPVAPGAVGEAATLNDVIEQEILYLRRHRHPDDPDARLRRTLVGLSLSGGGIRSATTGLGILQGLAELRILPLVDYMSTVSGGGYIGSCLSSLLSMNGSHIRKPESKSPRDRYSFSDGDDPAFTTRWSEFPFRSDVVQTAGRRASQILAHLRTHGNFLMARRGLLKRDTMRAFGNLLTGIVYNVTGFLAILFTASAIYLWAVSVVVPDIENWLGPIPAGAAYTSPKARTVAPAFGTDAVVRTAIRECSPSQADCFETATSTLQPPTLSRWTARNFSRMWHPFVAAFRDDTELGKQIRIVLYWSLGLGVLSAFGALGIIKATSVLFGRADLPPEAGETADEAADKALLSLLAIFIVTWIVISLFAISRRVDGGFARLSLLWVPLLVFLGARAANIMVAALRPGLDGWNRSFRSIWGGYQALTIYGMWIGTSFILLAPLIYAFAGNRLAASISGLAFLAAARVFTPKRAAGNDRLPHLPRGLSHMLLAAAVLLTVLFGLVAFGAIIVSFPSTSQNLVLAIAIGVSVIVVTGILVDHNKLSPHYFYRDRLAETYLFSELPDSERRLWTFRDATDLELKDLHGAFEGTSGRNTAPYHLISAAINLAGSRDLTRRDRKSGYFLFSKLYCGSTHTGFRPTAIYRDGTTRLARAITISGAAASSGIGYLTFFAQSFATVLFNVRLGYWLENPTFARSAYGNERSVFWPWYLWREVTMNTTEHTRLVNLSDGGHTGDNVGIYPLFQRRCKIIIACDAEQDAAITFGSFTEALRHAYVDMGISCDIDLSMIRPDPVTGRSKNHCAVGRIRYPDRPDQRSFIIYLKNTLTGDEPEPVLNYKSACPDFPHESTADLFFNDAQFESYRALGVHMVKSTFASWSGGPAFTVPEVLHSPWRAAE